MPGAVICNEESFLPVRTAMAQIAHCAGPGDMFVALRGMRTLSARLERHRASSRPMAADAARSLARALYPALPEDPRCSNLEARFSWCVRAFRDDSETGI